MSVLHELRNKVEDGLVVGAEKFVSKIKNQRLFQNARWDSLVHMSLVKNAPELTAAEKSAVNAVWGKLSKAVGQPSPDWEGHRFFKALGAFDSRNVMFDLLKPWVLGGLNPAHCVATMNNKLASLFYFHYLPRPVTRLTKFDGAFFDDGQRLITPEAAVECLTGLDRFIIKPLFECGGTGVKKLDFSEISKERRRSEAIELFNRYPDFLIQDILSQHPYMASFNP